MSLVRCGYNNGMAVSGTLPALRSEQLKREQLTIMKRRATAMLAAVTVVFLAVTAWGGDGTLAGYVQATAEASMVGGLADWFAVTALFRHPLGVPIPHTAIIVERKQQFGETLGEFIQQTFLTREVVIERLRSAGVVKRAADWATQPGNADRLARHVLDSAVAIADLVRDEDVHAAIDDVVRTRIEATPLAPLAGRALHFVTQDGRHEQVVDAASARTRQVPGRTPRRVPRATCPAGALVAARGSRGPHLRASARRRTGRVRRDGQGPESRVAPAARRTPCPTGDRPRDVTRAPGPRRADQARPSRATGAARLDGVAVVRHEGRSACASSRSGVGAAPATGGRLRAARVHDCRTTRLSRPRCRKHSRPRSATSQTTSTARSLTLVSGTIERWDAAETSRRLELLLGPDLQYIRINGTVVGGLAGLALHAISNVLH